MEKGKLQKRERCSFCLRSISSHLIPENDNTKPKGVAFFKGNMVHSKCFNRANGNGEFKEGGIKHSFKLENVGYEGEYFR